MKRNKILLIEDNPDHSDLIIETLTAEEQDYDGMEVVLIEDGQGALDYFQRKNLFGNSDSSGVYVNDEIFFQIDLILLDINLPKVNGLDVLEHIRRDPKYHKTPVAIMLTNYSNDTIEEAYRQGANGFLEKFVSYKKFVENLKLLKASFNVDNTSAKFPLSVRMCSV